MKPYKYIISFTVATIAASLILTLWLSGQAEWFNGGHAFMLGFFAPLVGLGTGAFLDSRARQAHEWGEGW